MDPQTPAPTVESAISHAGELTPTLFEPAWVVGMLVVAIVISWAIGKMSKMSGLRWLHHWLALGRVVLWALVIFEAVFAISWAMTDHWLVPGMLILAVMAIAGTHWLRNVAAGLTLAFEKNVYVGDMVGCDGIEGEVLALGARAVTLQSADGTRHHIPNAALTSGKITNLQTEGEAACEMVVEVPAGLGPDRALELATRAAMLTPLASPRRRPEVFVDTGAGDRMRLRIRGFTFDPAYRDHFRSDVIARLHALFAAEATPDKAA